MASPVLVVVAVLCFATLLYVYVGYRLILRVLVVCLQKPGSSESSTLERHAVLPRLTVLVTVYNEANVIKKRLENLLACEYPAPQLEVLVASDGSTDDTDAIVCGVKDSRIMLFRPKSGQGKSRTQNEAMARVTGDVVVFTDADTHFDRNFLLRIVAPFADKAVGGVDGHLIFQVEDTNELSASQNYYWNYESALRELESRLGILAVMSGACMAARRDLIRQLPPDVGEDCIVPLDIVEQGKRVVHASDALAYDRMEHAPVSEFRVRTRMTLRNWRGTWLHRRLLNPVRHPGYAFALWSHKLLRWLSPFMLIGMTMACAWLATTSRLFALATIALGMFYFLGFIGWWNIRLRLGIPLVGTIFSFLLANLGFMFGIVKAILGVRITSYTNTGKR